ncbi:unnamed protein product [Arabis nemorensis]|uniref:PGG domain-containing protein n=1 Tax=Arabis nemorensis TaxID=586526 RepID=A0A565BDA7_9BRAS|nr:unnamed protein product [Arabis nemorensis]
MNNQSPPMSTEDFEIGDEITVTLPEPPPNPPSRLWETLRDEHHKYLPLSHAISHGDLEGVKIHLDQNPEALSEWIDNTETPLLKACNSGQLEIVKELLRRMKTFEQLSTPRVKQTHSRLTPLIVVAATGNLEIAKVLVAKCPKLTEIPSSCGVFIPVLKASLDGHKEMTRFLYHRTPISILLANEGQFGSRILSNVIQYGFLDVALEIFEACPGLILSSGIDERQGIPLNHLAQNAELFRSSCDLPWWSQMIYSCIEVGPPNDQEASISSQYRRLLWMVLQLLPKWFGIKRINEMKESHIKAHSFLKLVCDYISPKIKDARWVVAAGRSLIYATMKGNREFVVEIIKSNPHLLRDFQADYKNIFQLAVQGRNSKIFNLIYGMGDRKKILLSEQDNVNNSVLHVAGALSSSDELSKVSGAALKMQREIQWYKEVESLIPVVTTTVYNLKGQKPREVFEEAHEPLRKEAEEWMKYTASACSFVAALIATVTFQAIFTVPGGTDDSSGDPLHLTDSRFMIFTIADTLSFFASCTSVLIFLTILTSRYSFDDFLVSLPKKMILGLSIMFFSIAAMLVAFSTALFTMLRKTPLLVIPVLPLACLPATLFVLLQYPLLKEMISSTYGNNLFKRDTKPWF